MQINKSFEDVCKDKPGTIYADWEINGYRCLVSRGPSSLCAYVGVKPEHIIYGIDYEELPIKCHGGLTYSIKGDDSFIWPSGYWWIGWDYGHSGDKSTHDNNFSYLPSYSNDSHAWTPDEVVAEVPEVVEQLKKIKRIPRTEYDYVVED